MKKIVGLTLELSAKVFLSLDKYQLKNLDWKHCFCYTTYRQCKKFYWSAPPPPPPPRDQTIPFAYNCSFTFHTSYKIGMIGHGGGGDAVKMLKNN